MWLQSVVKQSLIGVGVLMAAMSASSGAADLPTGLSVPPKATQMPAFDLPTTAGSTFRSESLRGQVVIVRYWASW